jgi:hypothetical protein
MILTLRRLSRFWDKEPAKTMNFSKKIAAAILNSPLRIPVYAGYRMLNGLFDSWLNINTAAENSKVGKPDDRSGNLGPHTEKAVYHDNIYYEPMNYLYIFRMLKRLDLKPDDVLYDIGCGKGRILCVAARQKMKQVIGVELLDELCQAARKNAGQLRGKQTPITVICNDAAQVDYPDGTVFIFFSPFGRATMSAVLTKLRQSFLSNPRRIRIAYYRAICDDLLELEPWLERSASFRSLSCECSFWKSKSS